MPGKALDIEQGVARDFGQIFYPDNAESGEPIPVILDIALEEDDEFRLSWDGPDGKNIAMYVPADRVRQLLQKK